MIERVAYPGGRRIDPNRHTVDAPRPELTTVSDRNQHDVVSALDVGRRRSPAALLAVCTAADHCRRARCPVGWRLVSLFIWARVRVRRLWCLERLLRPLKPVLDRVCDAVSPVPRTRVRAARSSLSRA